jgi:hypothetical protein
VRVRSCLLPVGVLARRIVPPEPDGISRRWQVVDARVQ